MKLIAILLTLALSVLLNGCTGHGQPAKEIALIQPGEGLVAVRLRSSYNGRFHIYFSKGKNITERLVANQNGFSSDGRKSLQLLAVPAGTYYWGSIYISAGATAELRDQTAFRVTAGKVNYIGDVKAAIFPRRLQALIRVKNRAAEAKSELRRLNPALMAKYPFVVNLSSIN